jgi:hypothetical protein
MVAVSGVLDGVQDVGEKQYQINGHNNSPHQKENKKEI